MPELPKSSETDRQIAMRGPTARDNAIPDEVTIRFATPRDLPAVLNVIDGAALETSFETARDATERNDVLVATATATAAAPDFDATVVGAVVLEDSEIHAIAVRPGRRGQGIGTALVLAAADARETLEARFHESVADFWRSMDFECERTDETDRFRGIRSG